MITETQQQNLDRLASLLKEVRGTDNTNPLGLTCEDYLEVIATMISDEERVIIHKNKSTFYVNIQKGDKIVWQVLGETIYWASKEMYSLLKSTL